MCWHSVVGGAIDVIKMACLIYLHAFLGDDIILATTIPKSSCCAIE